MKKKIFVILLVLTLVLVIGFGAVACIDPNKKPDTPDKENKKKNIIDPLPDMVDYGASSYWQQVMATNYTQADKDSWTSDLQEKRVDVLEDWTDNDKIPVNDWLDPDSENYKAYISFGPKATCFGESEARWQSNVGYFDLDRNWVTDESANTVERVYVYADPADIIERFSKAAIDRDVADGLVKYISRKDPDRAKGTGYTLTLGQSSAIEDYGQLEELEKIYEDFKAYQKDTSYATPKFETEEEVYDVMMLKERKIYGEIFTVFGDKAEQFARAAIALCGYAIEVISEDMIPKYEEHLGGTLKGNSKIIEYMRTEMYDYDTLSYLLSYKEYVNLTNTYEATASANYMGNAMTLYGYHYQYKHRDYLTFDDSVKVNYKGKTITEYEHFLKLSHYDYFDSDFDALEYRNYDRRQYEKSYRYTYACYQRYYEKQLNFQNLQEKYDREIYVGGYADRYADGLKFWDNSPNNSKNSITYTAEMQEAMSTGFEASLKLSDVNWEYTGNDQYVKAYNYASKEWNKLTDAQQKNPTNKIKKVKLEIEQLKSQDYTLNHKTVTDTDLTNALKYQIKSFSADSIRGIQSCKKDEVIYQKDIERFLAANQVASEDEINRQSNEIKEAYADLTESIGRNNAKYDNLTRNYRAAGVTSQMTTAGSADWGGVRLNVKETLGKDYDAYDARKDKNIQVDEYFQDTLIRKTYSCGGTFAVCKEEDGSHTNCTTEYDTNWALSRLLNNHEVVLRYMYGQIEVKFMQVDLSDIKAEAFFTSGPSGSSSQEAVAGKWYNKSKDYTESSTENIQSDELIGTICRKGYNEDQEPSYYLPGTLGAKQNWSNVPAYASERDLVKDTSAGESVITITKGRKTYKYTFAGWYVDEAFQYPVLLDEEYNYDIRLYPCYVMEIVQ